MNSKVFMFILIISWETAICHRKFDKRELNNLREEVRQMFQHAYDGYLKYAYPYDELRPLSCDGIDTWGSYSLTLIDALDTLAVMGNYSEFQRVVEIVMNRANFDANINVSVFETNIRIVGGLLSAHLLSHRAGVPLEPGWPCNGPLLRLAEDVARRLLAAFDTATGMPYGTVNLRHGIPEGETSVTCTAGIGTFILEMGTLSRLTGDPVYEEVAMNALYVLYNHRSSIGLMGNHIDVETGRWTAKDSGIGAGVDSYYEYLAKGAILLQRPELMHMFQDGKEAIEKYLKRDDWHMWVSMSKGQVTLPVFQSLEAFWPGVLSLVGEVNKGMKTLHNYHQVWKQYGFTPEYYNILQGEAGSNREGYPLRPELVESVMYLYRATGDPYLLEVGKDILRSIQHSARTSCGYATIKDVRDHRKEDRMESFFLAETTKYLYLLFDPENFIHNRGQHGTVIQMPWGECVIEAGGYIFNTEAHPIDPGALHCCSGHRKSDIFNILRTTDPKIIQGEKLSTLRNRTFFSQMSSDNQPDNLNNTSESESKTSSAEQKEREAFLKKLIRQVSATVNTKKPEDAEQLSGQLENNKTGINTQENEDDAEVSVTVEEEEDGFLKDINRVLNSVNGNSENENDDENNYDDSNDDDDDDREDDDDDGEENEETEEIPQVAAKQNDDFGKTSSSNSVKSDTKPSSDSDSDDFSEFNIEAEVDNNNNEVRIADKEDILKYQADDSDRVYRAKDSAANGAQVNLSEKDENGLGVNNIKKEDNQSEDKEMIKAYESNPPPKFPLLPPALAEFLLATMTPGTTFDPQVLSEKLQSQPKYTRNTTWESDYEILTCPAQPFLQRISISGELHQG